MSRADELRASLEAELAVVELEDALLAAKADPDIDPEAYQDVKRRLRVARQRFREMRSGGGPAAEGDAVASPATVEASTTVQEG